ncbi:MAG TPA: glycosyltransferase family 2 protein [bacterium]|nr:glycosyltransferase family 2 protein [bacterium]HOM26747.1 glycosyltransferase family 2 protein [bacterium]
MENEEIFSIITVSLNQGKYIEETIKSVIFQEGDFYLEYLILDGGSTDNTLEILEKYKKGFENKEIKINCKGLEFRYISEKDEGPTNALNKGFKLTKGEIIGILNSDDIYPTGILKKVWNTFKKNEKIDIVYGDVKFIDASGNFVKIKKNKRNIKEKDFIYENALIQPEVFLKRKVIEKVGIFDENLKFANDYEFWIRCLKNNLKFKYIPYTLAIFRKRYDARSSSSNLFIFVETLKVQKKYFGKTEKLLKNIGIYSAMYAYETKNSFENSFEMLEKNLSKNEIYLNKREIKKAKSYGYLKFSIYKIFENKKEGIKSYLKGFKNNPFIFFTKNNLIFIVRLILFHKNIYFGIKKFLKFF